MPESIQTIIGDLKHSRHIILSEENQKVVEELITIFQEVYQRDGFVDDPTARGRHLLLKKEVADILTHDVIAYLFLDPEGQQTHIQSNPPLTLRNIIIEGFKEEFLLGALGNLESDCTEEGIQVIGAQYQANTLRIIAAFEEVKKTYVFEPREYHAGVNTPKPQTLISVSDINQLYGITLKTILEKLSLSLDELLEWNDIDPKGDFYSPLGIKLEDPSPEARIAFFEEQEYPLFISLDLILQCLGTPGNSLPPPVRRRNAVLPPFPVEILPMTEDHFPFISDSANFSFSNLVGLDLRFSFIALKDGVLLGYLIAREESFNVHIMCLEEMIAGKEIKTKLKDKLKAAIHELNKPHSDEDSILILHEPVQSDAQWLIPLLKLAVEKTYRMLKQENTQFKEKNQAYNRTFSAFEEYLKSLTDERKNWIEGAFKEAQTCLERPDYLNQDIISLTNLFSRQFTGLIEKKFQVRLKPFLLALPTMSAASPGEDEGQEEATHNSTPSSGDSSVTAGRYKLWQPCDPQQPTSPPNKKGLGS